MIAHVHLNHSSISGGYCKHHLTISAARVYIYIYCLITVDYIPIGAGSVPMDSHSWSIPIKTQDTQEMVHSSHIPSGSLT